MSLVRRLRASICDTFDQVGPLAPTLCEGWLAQDLAAHLWIRERRPSALPGIRLARFADRTARIQAAALHTRGFAGLVSDLRRPAGLLGRLAPVNVAEFTIHHIDLSRPNGLDPDLDEADERSIWRTAALLVRRVAGAGGQRVVVTPSTGRGFAVGTGTRPVHLSGRPSEILTFVSGRDDADVTITAEPEAEKQFRASVLSL